MLCCWQKPLMSNPPEIMVCQNQDIVTAFAERGCLVDKDYLAFATQNGGRRFSGRRKYIRNRNSGELVGLGTPSHFDRQQTLYLIYDIWKQTNSLLPEDSVSFASVEFNGEICFDFRADKKNPHIVLFDYDAETGREIASFADDLAPLD